MIWQRMKEDAVGWAESGRPLPTVEESLERIGRIANVVLPDCWILPADACKFYADEFHSMVNVKRKAMLREMRRVSL